MSEHAEQTIKKVTDYIIKGLMALAAWFAISFFNEMRDSSDQVKLDMKALRSDVTIIKEQVIRMDDKVQYHDERIKHLENKK